MSGIYRSHASERCLKLEREVVMPNSINASSSVLLLADVVDVSSDMIGSCLDHENFQCRLLRLWVLWKV